MGGMLAATPSALLLASVVVVDGAEVLRPAPVVALTVGRLVKEDMGNWPFM